MILHFPHEIAFLPRTKLSYISLTGLLNDGKRDRTARVPGFVAINLGELCYLVFLRDGEPFHAACIASTAREPVAIAEVLRIVAEQIEHGEAGSIAYYGAPDHQLRTMLSTVVMPPLPLGVVLGSGSSEELLPTLRECAFTGVLELAAGQEVNYLCFEDGNFDTGYFSSRPPGVALDAFVRSTFDSADAGARIGLFKPLATLPEQAPPGLVELYRRLMQSVVDRLAERFGADDAANALREAQARISNDHPVVTQFELVNGRDDSAIRGEPVVSPEELTDTIAAWLTELLVTDAYAARVDPAEVIEMATRDDRFALANQGFFHRLPWPIAG